MSRDHKGEVRAARAPRLLSTAERDALVAVLSHADFSGRAALLEQVDAARVIGGCDCGCATVDLAIEGAPDSNAIAHPIPNEGTVLDADGEPIGGVLVFARDDYLSQLEVYSFGAEPISPFPPVGRLACTAETR